MVDSSQSASANSDFNEMEGFIGSNIVLCSFCLRATRNKISTLSRSVIFILVNASLNIIGLAVARVKTAEDATDASVSTVPETDSTRAKLDKITRIRILAKELAPFHMDLMGTFSNGTGLKIVHKKCNIVSNLQVFDLRF